MFDKLFKNANVSQVGTGKNPTNVLYSEITKQFFNTHFYL